MNNDLKECHAREKIITQNYIFKAHNGRWENEVNVFQETHIVMEESRSIDYTLIS